MLSRNIRMKMGAWEVNLIGIALVKLKQEDVKLQIHCELFSSYVVQVIPFS